MIIVKIFQGPGNQMFQYAYGLALSKRLGVELKLDTSWYESNSDHRSYILNRFNVETEIATTEEVEYIRTLNGKNVFDYRFNIIRDKFAARHKKAVIKEDLSIFDRGLLRPNQSSLIEGYFTTQDFFADYKPDIRKAFQFVIETPSEIREIANSINKKTVALSIRRGDFLGNNLHNICSVEYFNRAIDKIKESVSEPELLIFSDDESWVRSNMNFGVPHEFVGTVDDHMNHMRLMSMCKNHIIPNSTFSWWGVWLSQPQFVIAPNLWLTSNKAVHEKYFGHWVETSHTVPSTWTRIPAALDGETMM
jgi:hypothetical protein